jgi:hypothetical protein
LRRPGCLRISDRKGSGKIDMAVHDCVERLTEA